MSSLYPRLFKNLVNKPKPGRFLCLIFKIYYDDLRPYAQFPNFMEQQLYFDWGTKTLNSSDPLYCEGEHALFVAHLFMNDPKVGFQSLQGQKLVM